MIVIDGSKGEGGGQVLRTALSLSACTGQPFRIKNIRSGRKKPGLLRQHLTCVRACEEVCNGKAKGAALGAPEISFVPGEIRHGAYQFDIGTAGSTGLVFQTILPVLLQAGKPSTVRFGGGTHNKSAPPFEFLQDTFLSALQSIGLNVQLSLERVGFYPAGGGLWQADISPLETPKELELVEAGPVGGLSAHAIFANLPEKIAKRELAVVKQTLGLSDNNLLLLSHEAVGPGNAIMIRIQLQSHTEVFTGFGEQGTSAENVAKRAVGRAKRFMVSGAVVSENLADQLLLPLASNAGGRFVTEALSEHFKTNAEVIQAFLEVEISSEMLSERQYLVSVRH